MILLDTHVLLWLWGEPERLSKRAAGAIRSALAGGGIGIASITLWEIAMLAARRRIAVQGTVESWLDRLLGETSAIVRELTPAVAVLASQFADDYPRDPADRLIGATARAEGIPLVSSDEKIRACSLLTTVW